MLVPLYVLGRYLARTTDPSRLHVLKELSDIILKCGLDIMVDIVDTDTEELNGSSNW